MNILIVHGFEIATQINRISFTITVAFTYTQKLIEYKTAAIHFFFLLFCVNIHYDILCFDKKP